MKDSLLPDELVNKAREVVEANRKLGRRIAVAESCTGGLVSADSYVLGPATIFAHVPNTNADGTASVEEMGNRFFQMILETASGKKSKSEMHGYGQNEFVPWYLGAVM